jgi:flavin-dependent dehydrogenase
MAAPTVLISGAGIAGPALAFWLNKNGYRVTIVELADGIRPGGQTVDLRGAGGEVVERMGLLPEMRARSLDQRGVAWIKSDGRRRAEMPVTAFNGNGLVSKLEILRGDLIDVLYQATTDQTEYRFNTRITELRHNGDAVEATLSDGARLSVDLVVGADVPGPAQWHRRVSTEVGQRYRRYRPGDEVDAAVAVPLLCREKVVHHRRRHRATGLLSVLRQGKVRRGAEFGLGDAVDAVQCGLVHTDVLADHFGRDAGIAQPECQRVWQR